MNKVSVLTIEDVSIRKWHWWSDWIDVCVYDHGYGGYLLQMKVSRRNKKLFRTRSYQAMSGNYVSTIAVGDLTQMEAPQ